MEREHRRRAVSPGEKRPGNGWKRAAGILAAGVVFCTTYALILPAMTAERQASCGMEEHTHTEECFEDGVQVCGKEEHTHTEECYRKSSGITVGVVVGPQKEEEKKEDAQAPAAGSQEPGPEGGTAGVEPQAPEQQAQGAEGGELSQPAQGTESQKPGAEGEALSQPAQGAEGQTPEQQPEPVTLTGDPWEDAVAAAQAREGLREDGRAFIHAVFETAGIQGMPDPLDGEGACKGYADWAAEVRAAGLYREATSIPREGSVVFLDQEADGTLGREDERIDHAGVIVSVRTREKTNEETGETETALRDIMVLTDNADGEIGSCFYSMEDAAGLNVVAGYAALPGTEPEETQGPTETEAVTEESETETEAVTESQTEESETETEAITESQTEESETETEIITEDQIEESETETEAITEDQTEDMTEEQTETTTENQTEIVTERLTEKTEEQSESIMEAREAQSESAPGESEPQSETLTESAPDGEEPLPLPEGYYMAKQLTVTKNMTDAGGNAVTSDETFYAGIFTDAAFTQLADNVSQNIIPLPMGGQSAVSRTAELMLTEADETVFYVTEVDAGGTPVQRLGGFGYDMTVSNMVLTLSQDSEDPEVTIINALPEETKQEMNPQTEQKTDASEANIVPQDAKSVKTGDETPILPFLMAMILAAAVIRLLSARRRKRREDETQN